MGTERQVTRYGGRCGAGWGAMVLGVTAKIGLPLGHGDLAPVLDAKVMASAGALCRGVVAPDRAPWRLRVPLRFRSLYALRLPAFLLMESVVRSTETKREEEDFLAAFMAWSSRSATPCRWSRGGVAAVDAVHSGELFERAFVGVNSTDVAPASPLPQPHPPRLLHHLFHVLSLLRRSSLSSSAASFPLLLRRPSLASFAAPPTPP
ncbi:hypothetical protein Syun_014250 [Stephania yunnanensis]|uniref:Uncharacterized protein n=1 Tax=Stephania yunnanensis TaxID=152371 RepID=A0AAP0PBN0_9MAGN